MTMARRIGEAVQAHRRAAGWTAARLSQETARIGYPIHRVAIGKLETGHRGAKFDVAELVALAAALGVPPIELLYPGLPDAGVEIWPTFVRTSDVAMLWFTGDLSVGYLPEEHQNEGHTPWVIARVKQEDGGLAFLTRRRYQLQLTLEGAEQRIARVEGLLQDPLVDEPLSGDVRSMMVQLRKESVEGARLLLETTLYELQQLDLAIAACAAGENLSNEGDS